MERMNDGVLSGRLQSLYEIARKISDDVIIIDSEKTLQSRRKGLQNYILALSNFESQYKQIADQLELYADKRQLLDFIAEWAVYDPSILLDLAACLGLMQAWHNIPEHTLRRRK